MSLEPLLKPMRKRSSIAWEKWIHEGPAQGIGKMHRMTKVATGWIPSVVAPASKGVDADNGNEGDTDE